MLDHALIALILPIIALVLILVWMFLVICNKSNFKFNIKAFGISINLSADKGKQDANITQATMD